MKFLKKFRKGQKGFTLIELLVVIAILGVIAAVAVPNVLAFMGRGNTEAAAAELHNVVVAVTAALSESTATPPVVVAHAMGALTGDDTAAVNDTQLYLLDGQTTEWQYSISTTGQVVQGAKTP